MKKSHFIKHACVFLISLSSSALLASMGPLSEKQRSLLEKRLSELQERHISEIQQENNYKQGIQSYPVDNKQKIAYATLIALQASKNYKREKEIFNIQFKLAQYR